MDYIVSGCLEKEAVSGPESPMHFGSVVHLICYFIAPATSGDLSVESKCVITEQFGIKNTMKTV